MRPLPKLAQRVCLATVPGLQPLHAARARAPARADVRGSQGGFGEVWRVRKRVSNEEFALKVIDSNSPDILTPDVVAECARPGAGWPGSAERSSRAGFARCSR